MDDALNTFHRPLPWRRPCRRDPDIEHLGRDVRLSFHCPTEKTSLPQR